MERVWAGRGVGANRRHWWHRPGGLVRVNVQSLSTLKVTGTGWAPFKVEQLGQCHGLRVIKSRAAGGSYGHADILL